MKKQLCGRTTQCIDHSTAQYIQGAQLGSLDCTVCMRVAWLYCTCSCWGSLKAADLETHSCMYPRTQMYEPKWNTCTLRGGTWPSQHNCPESPWLPVLPLLVSLARQGTKRCTQTHCKQQQQQSLILDGAGDDLRRGKALIYMTLLDIDYGLTREVVGGIVRDYLHENVVR